MNFLMNWTIVRKLAVSMILAIATGIFILLWLQSTQIKKDMLSVSKQSNLTLTELIATMASSAIRWKQDEIIDQIFDNIIEQWDEIISRVSENGTSLSTFLSHGRPTELKGKRLIIAFPQKYKFQLDVLKNKVRGIESTIEKIVSFPLKIEFIIDKEESDEHDSKNEETHPVTKRMIDLFGGEIVE